jgi:polar amino acid transport system substrate-binding protein
MRPWPRAQQQVASGANLGIAPLTRTEARETHYKWIVPILSDPYYLYRLSSSVDESPRRDTLIVVQRASPGEDFLRDNGYVNLFATSSERIAARMLLHKRTSYWFAREMVAHVLLRQEGGNPVELEALMGFDTDPMYLAGGHGVSPSIIDRLRTAMTSLREDGTLDEIFRRYVQQ